MPLLGYLSLLRPGGQLIRKLSLLLIRHDTLKQLPWSPVVGAPEEPLPSFPAFPLIMNNVSSSNLDTLTSSF